MLEDRYEFINATRIDALLNLLNGTSSDVGKNPTGFLSDCFLLMSKNDINGINETSLYGNLSLGIVSSNDVTDGS
jgi:hypothetical protein|tara:strand:- start:478 stop:702 length:225 start_codon:yes stop_codon:yes gene_type:complete